MNELTSKLVQEKGIKGGRKHEIHIKRRHSWGGGKEVSYDEPDRGRRSHRKGAVTASLWRPILPGGGGACSALLG